MIGKALFLIENRHFLIRKRHFGLSRYPYVGHAGQPDPFPNQEFPMIRRKLLVATAIIASVVLAACSDMTAPKSNACPVINGSQVCLK
jgi:hypothetical protein